MKKEIAITDRLVTKYQLYLQEQERSNSTINNYIREIKALQFFADCDPINKAKLMAYKAMLSEKYAPTTVNVTIAAINNFLKFLGRQDLSIKPLKIQRNIFSAAEKELSKDDYNKLIRAAQLNGDERLCLAIQTICATGIRVSELQYITTNAITEGKTTISCKGKNRVILIPAKLCKLLKKYVINHNIVSGAIFITASGKPLDRSNLWKKMKQLCDIAGVSQAKVYPHNLRHLFARTYYSQQKDITRLADILGHSSINTTRIYTAETGVVHARQLEHLGLVRETPRDTT